MAGPLSGKVVFVVDDEPAISRTLAMILNQSGHQATSFDRPEKALLAVSATVPDFLITDVIMPGMNGIELAERLLSVNPTCKVILVSGQAETAELLEKACERGYEFDILAKPVHPKELLAKLRE